MKPEPKNNPECLYTINNDRISNGNMAKPIEVMENELI